MPLPTTTPETAESAYSRVVSTAAGVKSTLNYVASLIGLYQSLNAAQGVGLSIQGVDGLADYAKAQNGASYDINAEFMGSIIACKAVTDNLLTTMPSDGNGGFVGWRHQADGTITRLTVDASTLAPLASLITAALATFS